jgi:alpha-L-arabinofuranosidase
MTGIDRREFVSTTLSGVAALALPRERRARSADAHVEVLLDEPIGTIAPEVYGHFTEHLGGVIYDGIWVGEDSKIPNVGGLRSALVDAFRRIRPSVVRWPGGCFADSYDWRDGVGPRSQRPTRTNFWASDPGLAHVTSGPSKYEPNTFGTTEFARFCRAVGAQPYLAANVRSLPATAFNQWLEYCNAPAGATTWGDRRVAAGDREPYRVRYWGVGNEAWGCGGNFTPEEYAEEFRRFTTWSVPQFDVPLAFVASGPNGRDVDWTRRLLGALADRNSLDRIWGLSMHHYCDAADAGHDAVAFDSRGWYDLLVSADRIESIIASIWETMRIADRQHRVKLVVDEWGAWHANAPLADPSHLFESQSTMRDALVTGLTLDIFHRHADKIGMANVAQLVNCIHSLFFSHEERFTVTPAYHVFAMYAAHQGAQSVRTVIAAPQVSWLAKDGQHATFWGLNGSASRQGSSVTITLTNASLTETRETEVVLRGALPRSIRMTTLVAGDVHAVNTFDHPDAIAPVATDLPAVGATTIVRLPPASVVKLAVTLDR